MRKTFLSLMAVAMFAVGAQSAVADVPSTVEIDTHDTWIGAQCVTPFQYGVYGAFGAQGDFVDGCTVSVQCPAIWKSCRVVDTSLIWVDERHGHWVSLNSRVRFDGGFRDASCFDIDICQIKAADISLKPNQMVSVQCNGVRDENISDADQTLAKVQCTLYVERAG